MSSKSYYFTVTIYLAFILIKNLLSSSPFGYKFYSLFSTSMEPKIHSGSLVVIYRSTYEYQIGDVIAFYALVDGRETIVAHRVVDYGGNVYITKGDSNKSNDAVNVLPRLVVGKIIFHCPYIGYLLHAISQPLGLLFVVVLPSAAIVIIELVKIIKIIKTSN